ncbi:MAG: hypothetical protein AAF573_16760 [Bacteroidota bacterium]
MIAEVERIFLTKDFHQTRYEEDDKTNTEVIVHLNNGEKYIAAFTTFYKVEAQRIAHAETREFLGGKYFWEKNMILIDSCTEDNILLIVQHLLAEGDFLEVFEKI